MEAAIFVQCLNSCPEEVAWVSRLAEDHPVIKGIVGGLDLTQVRQDDDSNNFTYSLLAVNVLITENC